MTAARPGWVLEKSPSGVVILLADGSVSVTSESNGPAVDLGDLVFLSEDANFVVAPITIAHIFIQTGKIEEILEDGWVVVSSAKFGTLRVPHRSDIPYKAGDQVEFSPGKGVTRLMTRLHDDVSSEFLVHHGDFAETFEDIVGRDEDLATMTALVQLLVDPVEPTATLGALFSGPPGTGKTMFARALVNETPIEAFYYLHGPEITSKWVNESEERLRQLFENARTRHGSALIFIDEIDAIAGARTSTTVSQDNKFVGQLLSLMSGTETKGRVLVVGATNRVNLIDPALLRQGRLSTQVMFKLPDLIARYGILANTLPSQLLNDSLLNHFASSTEGWNGADIAGLAEQIKLLVLKDGRTAATIEDVFLAHEKVARNREITAPIEGSR